MLKKDKTFLSLIFLMNFIPTVVSAQACPATPQYPNATTDDLAFHNSWQGVADPYMARYTVGPDEQASYGIGYLNVINSDQYYYDWVRHVAIPLWNSPDETTFSGWIHHGRVYNESESAPFALTGAGLVETDYESSSFIVYEATADGWLKIRLKPGSEGLTWTHQCHLDFSDVKLEYKEWQSFLREHGDWMHFRSQVPHNLRERPDTSSQKVTVIGLNHKLELLEIQGDWMRVRVEQPDNTCSSLSMRETSGLIHEGWVKWRDDEIGPWVWVYTRGC